MRGKQHTKTPIGNQHMDTNDDTDACNMRIYRAYYGIFTPMTSVGVLPKAILNSASYADFVAARHHVKVDKCMSKRL